MKTMGLPILLKSRGVWTMPAGTCTKHVSVMTSFFLIALGPEKEPDLGIEIVYTGGIGALEGKELVEVMGMGIVDLEPLPLKEGKILKPLSSVT